MRLLIDTHVWLWSQESPEELGADARATLLDEENPIFVSTTSTLEIARLLALGRLRLTMDLSRWVEQALHFLVATTVPVTHEIAIEAYRLPEPFHRDPADRLLIATARIHGLHLVTADDLLLEYPGALTIDART